MLTTRVDGCVFCSDACQNPNTYGWAPTAPIPSLLLHHGARVRLLSDNSPLVAGHLLVVPDEHVLSIASLVPARLARVSRLTARLMAETASRCTGSALAFEHGTGADGRVSGCCIAHAHLHVLPVDVSREVRVWSQAEGRSAQPFTSLEQLSANAGREYLMVWQHGEIGSVFDAQGLPSQLLRRLVGEAVGQPLWNWQDRILLDDPAALTADLQASIRLAGRIVAATLGDQP